MNDPANLSMPLSSCDLSENNLGDSSVAALLKACELRNDSNNKGEPLQQLNLTANRITKVGQLWIATYLREAAGNFPNFPSCVVAPDQNCKTVCDIALTPRATLSQTTKTKT